VTTVLELTPSSSKEGSRKEIYSSNLCPLSYSLLPLMFKFLKQVADYGKETVQAAKYIGQGLSVTFDHMQRRPVTVQYPYETLSGTNSF
jgi:hypothetical protein